MPKTDSVHRRKERQLTMTKRKFDAYQSVLATATCLHTEPAVNLAVDRVARAVDARLKGSDPVVLCALRGGFMFAAWLTSRLDFPLEIDFAQLTRYHEDVKGKHLLWAVRPHLALDGRTVLVVDDIYDEGLTMSALVEDCHERGAAEVLTAVLVRKNHDRDRARMVPDFIGLDVPDLYVFGCGLDYRGYGRNLPAIYAVTQ